MNRQPKQKLTCKKWRPSPDGYFKTLKKRPVLGIPDALTTLEGGRGDCNEHAALFAALARSVGIPCRIVAGVTYHAEGLLLSRLE